HQRDSGRADRLADDAGIGGRQRRIGPLQIRGAPARHRRAGAHAVQPARRKAGARRRLALRPAAVADHSRRSPAIQTADGSRGDSDDERSAKRPIENPRDPPEEGGRMKALVWHGTNDVRVEHVPDPTILNPRDAIVKVTTTAICGSDLHLLDGYIPTMQAGDILGHEVMGEVVEVGTANAKLHVGDRVVVPFTIACGGCFFCERQMWSLCDNSNPNAWIAEQLYGYATSGLFGYLHLTGGYAGGQAQYARVPFADVGPLKVPDGLTDEQVLFLSDIFPTGYMAAE